jgi:hypothetical protein
MITIAGACMSGLLAARMLRDLNPVVIEQNVGLPNNHSAVLRFRTSTIGDILNIPFRKVQMIKTALAWRNPVADALAYAYKNGGIYRSDRSITSPDNNVVVDRYIAPPNLIAQMADRVEMHYGTEFNVAPKLPPTISTIPMPALMALLEYPNIPKFNYMGGWNLRARIQNSDAYISVLVPSPQQPFSRVSITGDELIIECPGTIQYETDGTVQRAADVLGISTDLISDVELIPQVYAKIQPIDNDVRKHFIWWATDTFNIYSLGRFATWRPALLLDDLVKDVRLIERWLTRNDRYEIAQHRR